MLFHYLKKLRITTLNTRKMSTNYNSVLKYWFGEDLSILKSDKYTGNNLVMNEAFLLSHVEIS